MLNRVIIMGRLGRNPELKTTQSGVSFVNFSIACDRDYKPETGDRETDWINITAWRGTAEFVSKYFQKGRMAIVEGRLQTREWTDKDGNKRVAVEILADHVYFGDSKRDGASSGGLDVPDSFPSPTGGDFKEIDEDDGDLPF